MFCDLFIPQMQTWGELLCENMIYFIHKQKFLISYIREWTKWSMTHIMGGVVKPPLTIWLIFLPRVLEWAKKLLHAVMKFTYLLSIISRSVRGGARWNIVTWVLTFMCSVMCLLHQAYFNNFRLCCVRLCWRRYVSFPLVPWSTAERNGYIYGR